MKIKKTLRLIALIFIIVLACIVPFPMQFNQKDNLPKDLIEQVEKREEEDDEDISKELF
ncbi:hypothetical protein [uncultured Psychroserpens sp.]|uniref:hypothetical protein n=1 Tax=uncultured Psychroserpens sp. TaxID=255436 RepID=UPI00260753BA|nr:hypothetical protein [uncultured Psychroserpens sp.]